MDDAAEDLDARRMSLDGIKRILDDFDEIYGDYQLSARVDMLLKFLAKRAAQEYRYISFQEKSPDNDAVQIMTVHKAKGLEFHTVFLPELTKNEFPARTLGGKQYYHVLGGTFAENKDKYQSTLDDERKLFYVAVTRAKQKRLTKKRAYDKLYPEPLGAGLISARVRAALAYGETGKRR